MRRSNFHLASLHPLTTPLTQGYSLRCYLMLTNSCFFSPLTRAEREVNREGREAGNRIGEESRLTEAWIKRGFGGRIGKESRKKAARTGSKRNLSYLGYLYAYINRDYMIARSGTSPARFATLNRYRGHTPWRLIKRRADNSRKTGAYK